MGVYWLCPLGVDSQTLWCTHKQAKGLVCLRSRVMWSPLWKHFWHHWSIHLSSTMLIATNCASFQFSEDIRKVRKRQHQYPEFGHTQGEIKKKPAKMYVSIQKLRVVKLKGVELRKPSILMAPEFHPVFLLSWAAPLLLIDFHCSYLSSYYNSSRTLCIKCWD